MLQKKTTDLEKKNLDRKHLTYQKQKFLVELLPHPKDYAQIPHICHKNVTI